MDTEETKIKSPTSSGFCWVEVPVNDMKRALKFYNEAFGWKPAMEMGGDDGFYNIMSNPYQNLQGALRKVSEDEHAAGTSKKHAVKAFIGLENIDAYVELIKQAGGEIINPGEEIPNGGGFFAEFFDSERNVLGIWAMKRE